MADIDASTPQLKVVKRFLDAYVSLDIKKVDPLMSKDYQYQSLPESIDLPEEAKGGHIQRVGEILALVNKLEVTVHEVIEAPGKVVIHLTGVVSTVYGATYTNDSVAIISFIEEDGELKVLRCKDFSDPQMRSVLLTEITKAVAERASAS